MSQSGGFTYLYGGGYMRLDAAGFDRFVHMPGGQTYDPFSGEAPVHDRTMPKEIANVRDGASGSGVLGWLFDKAMMLSSVTPAAPLAIAYGHYKAGGALLDRDFGQAALHLIDGAAGTKGLRNNYLNKFNVQAKPCNSSLHETDAASSAASTSRRRLL